MKRLVLAVALLAASSGFAGATVINFDDGTASSSVGGFYSGLGVTFSNTVWETNFGLPGSSGPLGIRAEDNGSIINPFQWLQDHAVVATFSTAATSVSIVGIDVGGNDLRIDAYDSPVGGSLVAFDLVMGSAFGIGDFYTLSVSGAAIFRVEMYQLTRLSPPLDGIVLDNLEFTPVPEPGTLLLVGSGIAALAARRRRRI